MQTKLNHYVLYMLLSVLVVLVSSHNVARIYRQPSDESDKDSHNKTQNFVLMFIEPDLCVDGRIISHKTGIDFTFSKGILPCTNKYEGNLPKEMKKRMKSSGRCNCEQLLECSIKSLLSWAEQVQQMSTASIQYMASASGAQNKEPPPSKHSETAVSKKRDEGSSDVSSTTVSRANSKKASRKLNPFALLKKRSVYFDPEFDFNEPERRRAVKLPVGERKKKRQDGKLREAMVYDVKRSCGVGKEIEELGKDDIAILPLRRDVDSKKHESELPILVKDTFASDTNLPVINAFSSRFLNKFNEINPWLGSDEDAAPIRPLKIQKHKTKSYKDPPVVVTELPLSYLVKLKPDDEGSDKDNAAAEICDESSSTTQSAATTCDEEEETTYKTTRTTYEKEDECSTESMDSEHNSTKSCEGKKEDDETLEATSENEEESNQQREEAATMDVWQMFGLISSIKNTFFNSVFGPGNGENDKFRGMSLKNMVKKLINQLTVMNNPHGYIAVIKGGKFSELKNESSDLMKTLKYLGNKCVMSGQSTLVVTSLCPRGSETKKLPLLAVGELSDQFKDVNELYEVPETVRLSIKSVDKECDKETKEETARMAKFKESMKSKLSSSDDEKNVDLVREDILD